MSSNTARVILLTGDSFPWHLPYDINSQPNTEALQWLFSPPMLTSFDNGTLAPA